MTEENGKVKRKSAIIQQAQRGGWFRLYTEILDNEDVQTLSGDTFKFWINLLAVTSTKRGFLPTAPKLAYRLRMTVHEVEEGLTILLSAGLLQWVDGEDGARLLQPRNWHKWQPPSALSTRRVQAHRQRIATAEKRSRNGDETVPKRSGNGDETDETYSTSTSDSPRTTVVPISQEEDTYLSYCESRSTTEVREGEGEDYDCDGGCDDEVLP